jgi:hypothetical protein
MGLGGDVVHVRNGHELPRILSALVSESPVVRLGRNIAGACA